MTNVSLRFKKTQRKRTYLYLDYYPPYMDPVTRVTKRQEYLGIYIYTNPSTPNEKYYNKPRNTPPPTYRLTLRALVAATLYM